MEEGLEIDLSTACMLKIPMIGKKKKKKNPQFMDRITLKFQKYSVETPES